METNTLGLRAKAMLVAVGSSIVLSAVPAFADDLRNDLDASIDASLETLHLVEGGADGTVHFSVVARDGDGTAGCNLTASAALTVNVHSSNSAVASVSPSALSFTNCTDVKTMTIDPLSDGTAEITLTQSANTSSGFFNLSSSTFVVIVANTPVVDTTPPVITYTLSPAPNAAGWNNSNVTLTWTVTDPESEILLKYGCETKVQTDGTSGQITTCVATSKGGTSAKSAKIMLDKAPPTVKISAPRNGVEYDLHQKVNVDWKASDNRSGVATASGTLPSGVMFNTATAGTHSFSVTATDNAGNATTVTVRYTVKDKDDGDDDEDDDDDKKDKDHKNEKKNARRQKVSICHKGKHSITVAAPALKGHLKHGDRIGRCNS